MYIVYVLKSRRNGKRYVGYTSKPLPTRLAWHRWGLTAWTRQNGPFDLMYEEKFEEKKSALLRERFLKSGQGRKELNQILPQQFPPKADPSSTNTT